MKKNMIAVILSIVIAIGSVGAIPVFAVETTAQEAVAIGSGTCGESAVWTLTGTEGDLTLTISGSGDMENFSWMGTPWKSYRGINACVIEDGITSIGDCAFRYTEISSISLPDSITSIGDYAFYGCYYLSNITIPNNVTSIGKYAFYDCESLKSVSISGNVRSIGDYAFALCATTAISGADHLLEVNYAGSEDEWNSISIGPNNSGLLNANIIFSSHNHIWNEEYSIDKEATCTEEGSESIHCSTCGKIDESTVRIIPKKDHSYGDWIVTKEPLCTEEGSREKHCLYNCGNKITEVIPATGHIWNEEYTVDVEASDTEEGSESIHCSVCDIIREGSTRVIEKTEHAYGEWEIVNAATCTETGLQKKICTVCGDEITEEIPATGHIWNTEYTVDKEPTATEEGLESIHCSVCDSVKEGSETVIPQILKPMTMLMISEPEEKTYTGSEITQEIVVIDGDKILVEGIDYTVEYTGNIYPGTATITIEGKGDYAGTITKQFKINQLAPPALSSVTAVDSGTGITLAWNAVAGANKYRIYRKAGTSSWRELAMTTATSYTDKNVSAGTKYTYTIRCIADDEKTYVSGYNATGMAITYAATPTLGTLSNQASGIKITWNKATVYFARKDHLSRPIRPPFTEK